jgi:hypothetical protein
MQAIGLPESAIRHQMKMNGISSDKADILISSNFEASLTRSTQFQHGYDQQIPASSPKTDHTFNNTQSSLQKMLQSKASTLYKVGTKSNEKIELTPEETELEMGKRRRAFDSMKKVLERDGLQIIGENRLSLCQQLGEGRFATVFQANMKNHDGDVAVKRFRYNDEDPPIGVIRSFKGEALCANYFAVHNLSKSVHEDGRDRIIQLLGVSLKPVLSLVFEFSTGGSLHDKVNRGKCVQRPVSAQKPIHF